jgi:hypothetical protein
MGLAAAGVWAQVPVPVNVIFLEPLEQVDTGGAEISAKNPLYRKVADTARYTAWLRNESAERAFRLYRDACEIARPGGGVPDYYVALVTDGNHATTAALSDRTTAFLRMVPGITEDEISRWLTERAARAFATPDDFSARQILAAAKLAALHFADRPKNL